MTTQKRLLFKVSLVWIHFKVISKAVPRGGLLGTIVRKSVFTTSISAFMVTVSWSHLEKAASPSPILWLPCRWPHSSYRVGGQMTEAWKSGSLIHEEAPGGWEPTDIWTFTGSITKAKTSVYEDRLKLPCEEEFIWVFMWTLLIFIASSVLQSSMPWPNKRCLQDDTFCLSRANKEDCEHFYLTILRGWVKDDNTLTVHPITTTTTKQPCFILRV